MEITAQFSAMIKRPILFALSLMFFRRTIREYGIEFFINLIAYIIFDAIMMTVIVGILLGMGYLTVQIVTSR
jgi:hypothetical protein